MKLYLYITNPEYFLRGDMNFCVRACGDSPEEVQKWAPEYIHAGECELDPSAISDSDIRQAALNQIEKERKELTAAHASKMHSLESRKQSLLAITHQEGK